MADQTSQDFSVVNSLFGIDPDQLARARQQADVQRANDEAARVAALAPQQQMTQQQLAGGTLAGQALAPMVRGALGVQQPVDPQMAFARTMKGIMDSLPQSGVDPSDPIAAQAYVGQQLMKSGFPAQGMMALENARIQKQKADADAAVAAQHQATAQKDIAEADPVARAVMNGHITPASWGQYIAGGKQDTTVLKPTERYMTVNTADGVWAVNKSDPSDRTRLGDLKPSAGGDKQAASDRFTQATAPYRGQDGNVDWVAFRKADPAAAQQAMLDARVAYGANNVQAVTKDTSGIEAQAQAVAKGEVAWPSARSPNYAQVIQRVKEINPNATADTFPTLQKTVNAFTSGTEGKGVRSFNVLQDHLGTLTDAIGALGNGNGNIPNFIGNKIAEFSGKPAPTNFDAVKEVVADEVVKAVVGTVASEKDREAIRKTIMSYRSPQQLMGAIDMYKKLAQGQLTGYRQQYKAGTGRDDFDTRILGVKTAPTDLLTAGQKAQAQGQAAYTAWYKALSPADKQAFKDAVTAARAQQGTAQPATTPAAQAPSAQGTLENQ